MFLEYPRLQLHWFLSAVFLAGISLKFCCPCVMCTLTESFPRALTTRLCLWRVNWKSAIYQ